MYYNNQVFLESDGDAAVLLMHGLTSGAAQMLPMAHYLNENGYAVSVVNLAGHGTYPEDLLHTTAEDFVSKAEYDYQLLIKKGYKKIFVSGLSTGGVLSLYLASLHPEIIGYIPISAPMAMVPGTFLTAEYPVEQEFFHRDLAGKTGLARFYHIHYEDIAVRVFTELGRLIEIVKRDEVLSNIKCSGLIIQAKNDEVAEPSSAPYIYDHVASLDKELFRPESGGHNIVLAPERFSVFEKTVAFLDQHVNR